MEARAPTNVKLVFALAALAAALLVVAWVVFMPAGVRDCGNCSGSRERIVPRTAPLPDDSPPPAVRKEPWVPVLPDVRKPAPTKAVPQKTPVEQPAPKAGDAEQLTEADKPRLREPPKPTVEEDENINDPAVRIMRRDAEILLAKQEFTDEQIEVQHLLVSFAGTRSKATRTKAEAEKLAAELWDRAARGEDFDDLVKKYTDDSAPGKYWMRTGDAKVGDDGVHRFARKGMVQGFGDVAWRLRVGEVGIIVYDAKTSPFGWDIIKRLK
jgi:hypothetical protein